MKFLHARSWTVPEHRETSVLWSTLSSVRCTRGQTKHQRAVDRNKSWTHCRWRGGGHRLPGAAQARTWSVVTASRSRSRILLRCQVHCSVLLLVVAGVVPRCSRPRAHRRRRPTRPLVSLSRPHTGPGVSVGVATATMSDYADQGRRYKQPVGSPPSQSALAYMSADSDSHHGHVQLPTSPSRNAPLSAPPGNSIHIPDRPNFPTRASTAPSPHEHDPRKQKSVDVHYSRSDDFNHSDVAYANDQQASDLGLSRSQGLLTTSRPATPASSSTYTQPGSSDNPSSSRRRRPSTASDNTSLYSDSSANGAGGQTPASTTHTSTSVSTTYVLPQLHALP